MPSWNIQYYTSLEERFAELTSGLDDRLEQIIKGRTPPASEDISIGSARKLRAAILFFDLRDFSGRTGSPDDQSMKQALELLDVVIPIVMQIVFDFGGYVEKNTGDGIMAIFVSGEDDEISKAALDCAMVIFYTLREIVNPHLRTLGILDINARIGIDLGWVLLARIGLPTGSSKFERNFLTAVGPAANLACRLQAMAETNQIYVGDLIKRNALPEWEQFFHDKTPPTWQWAYENAPNIPYRVWHFGAKRKPPSTQ